MTWNDRTCGLDELDHVIHAHLDTPLTVDGLCRMTKEDLACAIIALRRDWHRESEVDSAEWEEDQERLKQAEARVADLSREVAWLRYVLTTKLGHSAGSTMPPPEWTLSCAAPDHEPHGNE